MSEDGVPARACGRDAADADVGVQMYDHVGWVDHECDVPDRDAKGGRHGVAVDFVGVERDVVLCGWVEESVDLGGDLGGEIDEGGAAVDEDLDAGFVVGRGVVGRLVVALFGGGVARAVGEPSRGDGVEGVVRGCRGRDVEVLRGRELEGGVGEDGEVRNVWDATDAEEGVGAATGEGEAEDGIDGVLLIHACEDGVVGGLGGGAVGSWVVARVGFDFGGEGEAEQATGSAVAVPVGVIDEGDLLLLDGDPRNGYLFGAVYAIEELAVSVGAVEVFVLDFLEGGGGVAGGTEFACSLAFCAGVA